MVDLHNIVVAASNIFYVFLSAWLLSRKQYTEAFLLLGVAIASTIFHIEPENKNNKLIDIITANAAILITFLLYVPMWQRKGQKINFNIIFALVSAALGLVLFIVSGDDHDSTEYVIMHSFWHILTALAAYMFIKESI